MTERIVLATIADVHGIKGLVKIFPYGEDISLLESIEPLYAENKAVKITLKNALGKFILAEIEGVSTREDAEKLKGHELSVDKAALPALDHDEDGYYHHDLIGLKALNQQGEEVGTVIAVDNYGAGDLLEIRKSAGEKFLLPFTDDYVPNVNLDAGFVTIIELNEI